VRTRTPRSSIAGDTTTSVSVGRGFDSLHPFLSLFSRLGGFQRCLSMAFSCCSMISRTEFVASPTAIPFHSHDATTVRSPSETSANHANPCLLLCDDVKRLFPQCFGAVSSFSEIFQPPRAPSVAGGCDVNQKSARSILEQFRLPRKYFLAYLAHLHPRRLPKRRAPDFTR
jgi:hypothetical protein